MKITVTQEHIDRGLRGSCDKDPVALGMKDAGLTGVWVSPYSLRWVTRLGEKFETSQPPEVEKFIRDFDNVRCVDPFTFELDVYASEKATSQTD